MGPPGGIELPSTHYEGAALPLCYGGFENLQTAGGATRRLAAQRVRCPERSSSSSSASPANIWMVHDVKERGHCWPAGTSRNSSMRPTNLSRCVNNTRERFRGAKHAQALTFEAATRKPMLRPALALRMRGADLRGSLVLSVYWAICGPSACWRREWPCRRFSLDFLNPVGISRDNPL